MKDSKKKTAHNGVQDTKIERIQKDIEKIKESVRILNHNTTTNSTNIGWMKWAIFAILGGMISISLQMFVG